MKTALALLVVGLLLVAGLPAVAQGEPANLLPNGDVRLEILNGVKMGKDPNWFNLNFVRLYRDSGNALLDYDSDHSQIVLNFKKDMLF